MNASMFYNFKFPFVCWFEMVIAFSFYKGTAEAVLHEIVILFATCFFYAILIHR